MSGLDRVRKCGRTAKGLTVDVAVSQDGRAAFQGLTTCGSVWACPACARKILARRAQELGQAVELWDRAGGSVAMVTLTMRHDRGDALADLWDSLSDAWGAAWQTRRTKTVKPLAGVKGWARCVEATHGANGWHLHIHALVLLEHADRADQLGRAMFDGWSARLQRRGLRAPIADSGGLDVKVLDVGKAAERIGDYLAKGTLPVSDGLSAARELTGHATKRARRRNRTPFAILADVAAHDDAGALRDRAYRRDVALWHEWEDASRGRRALTWSVGIRELLGLAEEQTDEELVADDDQAEVVARIPLRTWRELRWRPDLPSLLDVVETAAPSTRLYVVNAWLEYRGFFPAQAPQARPPAQVATVVPPRRHADQVVMFSDSAIAA